MFAIGEEGLEEHHFEHRRLRERQGSLEEYDPDNDDYEMTVQKETVEVVEAKEKQLLRKQIWHLYHRIQAGAGWKIWTNNILKELDLKNKTI